MIPSTLVLNMLVAESAGARFSDALRVGTLCTMVRPPISLFVAMTLGKDAKPGAAVATSTAPTTDLAMPGTPTPKG